MGLFTRTTRVSQDAQRHRLGEASAYEGLAAARRDEAAQTDDPARRRQLLGRARDADRQARSLRRGR